MGISLLGISGSVREHSSNVRILEICKSFLLPEVSLDIFSGLEDIPHFIPGTEGEPASFTRLRLALEAADGVIICTPEYAFGIPAVLKNALEWTVGVSGFNTKPTALITASTSGEKGHRALLWVLEALGADMNEQTQLLIQFIKAKMDAEGNMKDEATLSAIEGVVASLLSLINEKNPSSQ